MNPRAERPALERLRRIPGLEACTTRELVLIGSIADACTLPAGTVVLRGGAPAYRAVLLSAGELTVLAGDGASRVAGPGTLLGAKETLAGTPYPGTVVAAAGGAEVLVFGSGALPRFLALPSVRQAVEFGRGRERG